MTPNSKNVRDDRAYMISPQDDSGEHWTDELLRELRADLPALQEAYAKNLCNRIANANDGPKLATFTIDNGGMSGNGRITF